MTGELANAIDVYLPFYFSIFLKNFFKELIYLQTFHFLRIKWTNSLLSHKFFFSSSKRQKKRLLHYGIYLILSIIIFHILSFCHRYLSCFDFGCFLGNQSRHIHYLFAFVRTAYSAQSMSDMHRRTVCAFGKTHIFQGVMRPPIVSVSPSRSHSVYHISLY